MSSDLIQGAIVDQIKDTAGKLAAIVNGYNIIDPKHNIIHNVNRIRPDNTVIPKAREKTGNEKVSQIEITYDLGQLKIASSTVRFKIEEDRNDIKSLTANITQTVSNYGKGVEIFLLYLMLLLSHQSGVKHVRVPIRYKQEELIRGLLAERERLRYRIDFDSDTEVLLNLKKIDQNGMADLSLAVAKLVEHNHTGIWSNPDPVDELEKIARMIPPPEKEKNVANKLKGFKNNLQNSTKRQRMLNNAKGQLNSGLSKAKNLGSQAWGSFSNRFLSKSTPAPAAAPAPQPAPAAAPAAAPAPAAPQPAAKKGFFGWGGARRSVKRRSSKAHRKSSKAHHKRRKSSKRH